jgi:hypothetical protein
LVVRQDREAFDAGLKAVLDEVRVNLDLGVLNDFVHRWWISACDSARDPEGRRRMHARAEQVLAGEAAAPTRPWREILAERESGRCTNSVWIRPQRSARHCTRSLSSAGSSVSASMGTMYETRRCRPASLPRPWRFSTPLAPIVPSSPSS